MSQLIRCPECDINMSIVKDSRTSDKVNEVRRRRLCSNGHRFTTYEIVEKDLSHARAVKKMLNQLSGAIEAITVLSGSIKTAEDELDNRRVFTSLSNGGRINNTEEA